MSKVRKNKILKLLIFTLALFTSGCSLAPKEEVLPDPPVISEASVEEYRKAEVIRGDIIERVTVECRYNAYNMENLSFKVNGLGIYNVYVEEGDYVKAGDILAELNMDDLDEQIEGQLEKIDLIKLRLVHQNELKDLTLSTRDTLRQMDGYNDQIEARYEGELAGHDDSINKLEGELYIDEKRLDKLFEEVEKRQLLAGIDGLISYIYDYNDWDVSDKDRRFITIYDPDSMVFVTDGNDSELFSPGQIVEVSVLNTKYPAVVLSQEEVDRFNGDDSVEGAIYLRLTDGNEIIETNSRGTIEFVLNEYKDVLYLPQSAVHRDNERMIVYVEDEGGFKSIKEVETGIVSDRKIEILSGLEEGDSVIID